jgi:hypothetical protein
MGEPYSFNPERGAIQLIVEAADLKPHARGIAGQTWPSDTVIG